MASRYPRVVVILAICVIVIVVIIVTLVESLDVVFPVFRGEKNEIGWRVLIHCIAMKLGVIILESSSTSSF